MFKFKQSVLVFVGFSLVLGLIALFSSTTTRGQGGGGANQQPRNVNVLNVPARQAFHAELPVQVPAGKRLVIEFFSAQATTAPDCKLLSLNVSTRLDDIGAVTHSFAPTYAVVSGGVQVLNRVTFSHSTQLYADPGGMIGVGSTTAGFNCNLQISHSTISGYFVDMP